MQDKVCTLQDVPLPQVAGPKIVDITHSRKVSEAMEQLVTEAEGHESQELGSLLNKFSDIFSSGNEDLGRTSLVYHKSTLGRLIH